MSARDRKLLMMFVPLAVFAVYWLLLLNPALDRREGLQKPLAQARVERDTAVAAADKMAAAKENYEKDYDELVKLSQAIPDSVAVSDLMRELNSAAHGMGIEFSNITMAPPEAGPEQTVATTASPDTASLDEIPVELTFDGRFFALADLFHAVQRFVAVADDHLEVHGRLIRIDEFSFDSASFPSITAQISATVFAAPADEGATAGATPAGPTGAERGDGGLQPVQNFSSVAVKP
jgi:Tfp pilus assembly protein PilO